MALTMPTRPFYGISGGHVTARRRRCAVLAYHKDQEGVEAADGHMIKTGSVDSAGVTTHCRAFGAVNARQ